MKRIFTLIFACLIAFLFIGCDIPGVNIGGDGDGDGGTTQEPSDKLAMSQEQSESKFQEIAANGYEITFVFSSNDDEGEESGTMTMGAKGNVVWVLIDGEGMALVDDNGQIHMYNTEEGEFVFAYTLPKEASESLYESYQGLASPYLYWANGYDGSLKKGADAKVAGRNCYTYELDLSASLGAYAQMEGIENLKYKVYVDKDLGITMKVEAAATVDGSSSSFNYEVTSLKIGSEVTAPRLPEPVNVEGEDGEE